MNKKLIYIFVALVLITGTYFIERNWPVSSQLLDKKALHKESISVEQVKQHPEKSNKKELTGLLHKNPSQAISNEKPNFRSALDNLLADPDFTRRGEFIKNTLATLDKAKFDEIFDIFIWEQGARNSKKNITGVILSEISSDEGLNWYYDALQPHLNDEDALAHFVSSTLYVSSANSFDKLMTLVDMPVPDQLQGRLYDGIMMIYQGSMETPRHFDLISKWVSENNNISETQERVIVGLLRNGTIETVKTFYAEYYNKARYRVSNRARTKNQTGPLGSSIKTTDNRSRSFDYDHFIESASSRSIKVALDWSLVDLSLLYP